MNRKFVSEVLKQLPTYNVTQRNYFFETPFEHILAGFAWERPRGRIYVWKYAFPLFEDFSTIHLGYGSRLPQPDDSLLFERGAEKRLAHEFVERIERYRRATSDLRDVSNFVRFLESQPKRFENPLLRRGYALALLMTGDENSAIRQLYLCLDASEDVKLRESLIRHLLSIERGDAVANLMKRENDMKKMLGIVGPEMHQKNEKHRS